MLLVFLLGLIGYTKETFDVDFDRKQDESPKFKLKGSWRVENQEQQVERLIRELQDTDSDVRSIAAVTLGEIGPEAEDAVPILIKLLQDQDAEGFVRANAATALGKIGEGASKAVPALINALRDQDKYVRKDAAEALEKIGTPRTIKTVKDRYRVVIPLGWIGSEDEVPALIQALQNENKDVRVNAVVTLGEIESEDVVPVLIKALQDQLNVSKLISSLLLYRGIDTFEKAKKFFRPSLSDLHDPFLMQDMQKAVDRIQQAIKENEKILVFGDYDVDGTTSVALVSSFLNKHLSDTVLTYIPDRYTEGYGISMKSIEFAESKNVILIIALDCGIQALDQVEYAKEKNIDFIICDHHTPPSEIPKAIAVLNPLRKDCSYPYKSLCGCGIGFKLIQGLNGNTLDHLEEYLDLVALAIAARDY